MGPAKSTSQPTASDAVSTLVQKGWVKKEPSQHDMRSVMISLTEMGRNRLDELRFENTPINQIINQLSKEDRINFYRISLNLIWQLQQDNVIPKSRMCLRCRYFDPRAEVGAQPHYCHYFRESFDDSQLHIECEQHVAAEPNHQITLFRRFAHSSPQLETTEK